jgi:hypothetical protein
VFLVDTSTYHYTLVAPDKPFWENALKDIFPDTTVVSMWSPKHLR